MDCILADYRNGNDEVNPAKYRTLGGFFHHQFVLHLLATLSHLLWPRFEQCLSEKLQIPRSARDDNAVRTSE
jgi:hypothetical protein